MQTRNLELKISLSNVEAGLLPILNATTSIHDDEDMTNFEFVKYDKKSGHLHFKAVASKISKERTPLLN
mgnify:CR=1 FL=1